MEPSIIETSETESFSSDHSKKGKTQEESVDTSLDSLFEQLSQETNGIRDDETQENQPEFKQIQASIRNLPKINSELEKKLNQVSSSKTDIVRINDPIISKSAKVESNDSGSRWFNMKQPELTPELKRDLQIIKQRSALDPKRHYKKDKWEVPKYFQMGTIIEGNAEFYSARLSRKQRGNTLVEEILHDDDTKKYFKRKYSEIQSSKTSGKKGHYKKVKEMRKKF
ncbi:Fcf2 pre-rRNA processing-domain-containing protein [Scheffersomyces amazonensis]|uniref:Fcf2 pre-rRNA processing-domain-containing protein n=1 Tax=Scheffersomyces amazonensis TaxID=1078765 RepID=UPI00315D3E0F